jgi:hypothetical protein
VPLYEYVNFETVGKKEAWWQCRSLTVDIELHNAVNFKSKWNTNWKMFNYIKKYEHKRTNEFPIHITTIKTLRKVCVYVYSIFEITGSKSRGIRRSNDIDTT